MEPVKILVSVAQAIIDAFPVESTCVCLGDANRNKIPDFSLNFHLENGRTITLPVIDVPQASIGGLLQQVTALAEAKKGR